MTDAAPTTPPPPPPNDPITDDSIRVLLVELTKARVDKLLDTALVHGHDQTSMLVAGTSSFQIMLVRSWAEDIASTIDIDTLLAITLLQKDIRTTDLSKDDLATRLDRITDTLYSTRVRKVAAERAERVMARRAARSGVTVTLAGDDKNTQE